METTCFDKETLQLLQRRARAAGRPGEGPDGWTVSENDPTDLVRVFKTLRIKPGFKLMGFQFRAGANGNGIVFAFPLDEHPDLATAERNHGTILEPPVFPTALPHFMDAIEGDGTTMSYISASLLIRELDEFGAEWHGCSWSSHELLDSDPRMNVIQDSTKWTWKTRRTIEWRPHVIRSRNRVTASFCTFTGLEMERIVEHINIFKPGSYRPASSARNLALGPMGYIH